MGTSSEWSHFDLYGCLSTSWLAVGVRRGSISFLSSLGSGEGACEPEADIPGRRKLQAYRRSSRVATDWLEEQPGQSPNERVQAVAMGWDWEWRVWNTMRALPQQHECHELKCSSFPLACTPVHSIHGFSTIVDAAGTLKLDAKGTSRGTCRRPSKRAKFKSTAEPDKDRSSSGIPIDVKVASPSLATVPY